MKRISLLAASCGLFLFGLLAVQPASAVTLDFFAICEEGNAAMVGEQQFRLDVEQADTDMVSFTIRNLGPEPSVISEVYFDDGYLSFDSFIESAGVDYEVGASPGDLPGGNSITPNFDADLAFQAMNPSPFNGIGPDEWLTIVMDLDAGTTFADVLDDLLGPDLRVGLHAQAFMDDESCSFVNNPIPIPGAVWLLGSGLLGLLGLRRKRSA
jgi:hypothetical protein